VSNEEPLRARLSRGSDAVPVRLESRALRRSVITVLVLWVLFELARAIVESLSHFLLVILLAWLLSIAMEPGVAWLANRGMRRGAATGIVLAFVVVLTLGFVAIFGGVFFTQLAELVQQTPQIVTQAVSWLNSTFHLQLNPTTILDALRITPEQIASIATNLAGGVFGVFGIVVGGIFDALTMLVFAFYLSADGPRLRRVIGSWMPETSQKVFVMVWDIAVTKTGGFVVSKVVLATISALAHSAAFYVIGVPYWLPMGVFAGVVSQFIPTIGTYVGIIVPALFAVFVQPFDVVWIVLFATVYQQIENYILTPRISRVTMDIHPALALASVFVGVALFGPVGALIGIPLAAAVVAIVDTYTRRYDLIPELQVRTRGEKPARHGDAFAGDPDAVVPAGAAIQGAQAEADAAEQAQAAAQESAAEESAAEGDPAPPSNDRPDPA